MSLILDIETVPKAEEQLLAVMPDSLREPVMPESIKNPFIPEEGDLEAPKTFKDPEKIAAWKKEKRAKLIEESKQAQAAWTLKAAQERESFIERSTLDAKFSQVKMIGFNQDIDDANTGRIMILVAESDVEISKMLMATPWPDDVAVVAYDTERKILERSFQRMTNLSLQETYTNKLVTYYGNTFDLPYLFRRAWINRVKKLPYGLRRGRYFDDARVIDLHELWQLGDRQYKVGGLDGLCQSLGVQRKNGDGGRFHELYKANPVAAVEYLINDLECTMAAARAMGVCEEEPS